MSNGNDRVDWTVLGVVIGTGTGWDEQDHMAFVIYEFQPADNIDLPPGDVCVFYNEGEFRYYDSEGELKQSFKIMDVFQSARKV